MPNLNYHIDYDEGQTLRVIAAVRAIGMGMEGEIKDIINDAVKEGERVAKMGVPRGRTHALESAIQARESRGYHPGGGIHDASGWHPGGGQYDATLKVSGSIARHLEFIWSGTGLRHIPDRRELIQSHRTWFSSRRWRPAHEPMPMIVEGKGLIFRQWSRGQVPQRQWWQDAQHAVETVVATRVASMNLGLMGR